MNADIDIKPITAAVPTTLFDRTEQSEEDAAEEITEELPQVTVTDVGRSWVRLLNPFRLTPRPNAEKPE